MKDIEVFKKGNVWGFFFEVYKDEARTYDDKTAIINTRIGKTGYATKIEAITAGFVFRTHFYKMLPVTDGDIEEDWELFELVDNGFLTSEEASKYIHYLTSSAVINNKDNNDEDDNRILLRDYLCDKYREQNESNNDKDNDDRIIMQEDNDLPQEYYEQMARAERDDKPIDYKDEDDIY